MITIKHMQISAGVMIDLSSNLLYNMSNLTKSFVIIKLVIIVSKFWIEGTCVISDSVVQIYPMFLLLQYWP